MTSCEYLGALDLDAAGHVRIRPVVIAPLPEREYRPIAVPTSVARRIDAGHAFAAPVIGDSMQPVILDNDTIVVSRVREPNKGDIVIVRATQPDPKFGELWGVVIRVIHRQFRDLYENHVAVQKIIALHQSCQWGRPPVGDRRVALTREGGQVHLWQSIAVVRRVQHHVQSRDAAKELVHVSGYVKRDGTFVPPLDRPMPMNANQKWTSKSSSHRGELGFSIRHSPITP